MKCAVSYLWFCFLSCFFLYLYVSWIEAFGRLPAPYIIRVMVSASADSEMTHPRVGVTRAQSGVSDRRQGGRSGLLDELCLPNGGVVLTLVFCSSFQRCWMLLVVSFVFFVFLRTSECKGKKMAHFLIIIPENSHVLFKRCTDLLKLMYRRP